MKVARKVIVGGAIAGLVGIAGGGAALAAGGGSSSPQPAGGTNGQVTAALTPFDTSTETQYTPITPCRIVDTRIGGGLLSSGHPRSWFVAGTTGFLPQGGTAGGCGVPAAASAVSVQVTTVTPSGSGYLKLYPFGAASPKASFLNYTHIFNAASGGDVTINTAGARHVTAAAFGAATHVIIDVSGYYLKSMSAEVNSNGTLVHSSRAVSSTRLGTGQYEVVFDRDVTACTYEATPFLNPYTIAVEPRSGKPNGVFIYSETPSGTLADQLFYLTVTC